MIGSAGAVRQGLSYQILRVSIEEIYPSEEDISVDIYGLQAFIQKYPTLVPNSVKVRKNLLTNKDRRFVSQP